MISCLNGVFIRHYLGCLMAVWVASQALSRFVVPRRTFYFVLFLDKTAVERGFHLNCTSILSFHDTHQTSARKLVTERPIPGRISIWRWSPINYLWPASRIFIDLAKCCYTASNLFETILQNYWYLPRRLYFSFDFCKFNSTVNPRECSSYGIECRGIFEHKKQKMAVIPMLRVEAWVLLPNALKCWHTAL